MKNNKTAFTLLEILVALTIFSIFMVSMIMIYASSANIDRKIDINRAMQENSKNIIETIAEDIRINGID
jgi:prepilin-type N-terminal cleavage/methylation domain-containing protein